MTKLYIVMATGDLAGVPSYYCKDAIYQSREDAEEYISGLVELETADMLSDEVDHKFRDGGHEYHILETTSTWHNSIGPNSQWPMTGVMRHKLSTWASRLNPNLTYEDAFWAYGEMQKRSLGLPYEETLKARL
jgi:hypothetical protein